MPPKVNRTKPISSRPGTTTSVVDRISSFGFDEDDGIKLCLYGYSGTGKTTFWATAPGQILAILASGGSKPGELRSINTPEYRKKIKQVPLRSGDEIFELAEHVRESGDYRTVVLDHATGLQDLVLKGILGLDEMPAQKSWGLASQQQYGQCTLKCKEYLRALLSLDCNVIIVAQERNFNDEGNSEVLAPKVGAALSPSLTTWLNQACDYICQTFVRPKYKVDSTTLGQGKNAKTVETRTRVKGVEYCLRTAKDDVYITKFRLPKGHHLPDAIVDPDYDKLLRVINGELDE